MPASFEQSEWCGLLPARHSIDVLIGTTVLEVGIDLPQTTLCGPRTERIAAVCATRDGLQLAERDLALRGSGELLGQQQSGFDELRALDPVTDLELLLAVRDAVSPPPTSR